MPGNETARQCGHCIFSFYKEPVLLSAVSVPTSSAWKLFLHTLFLGISPLSVWSLQINCLLLGCFKGIEMSLSLCRFWCGPLCSLSFPVLLVAKPQRHHYGLCWKLMAYIFTYVSFVSDPIFRFLIELCWSIDHFRLFWLFCLFYGEGYNQ